MARIIARPDGTASGSLARDWRACTARVEQGTPARSQAATILLNARAQARAIIAEAQETARSVAAAERRQAWESGYTDGMAQAGQQIAAAAQRLAALAASAAVAQEASLHNLDGAVLDLVLAISGAVIRREVECDPDMILRVAQSALSEMSAGPTVALRIHPDDEELLQSSLPALGLPASVHVALVADPTVSRGGCLIESGAGRVDATIETQIERLGQLLREHLHAA